jgi:hypothetical protein
VDPDPSEIAEAIDDIKAARKVVGDVPAALRISLRTHLVATGVFRTAPERAAARAQAWKDFLALARDRFNPDVANLRYYFLREMGEWEWALVESRAVYERTKDPWAAYNHAQALYLIGEYEEAARIRREAGGRDLDWVLLLAVAETDGRGRAHDLYLEMEKKGLADWDAYNGLLMLHALGYEAEARRKATELLTDPKKLPVLRTEQFRRAVRFLARQLDEERFLNPRGLDRADLNNVYLSVGLKRLAVGDRAGAREQLQAVKDLWVIDFIPYDIACLLLRRMEKDPTWPKWIPEADPAGGRRQKP